jgi:hypothetical protein
MTSISRTAPVIAPVIVVIIPVIVPVISGLNWGHYTSSGGLGMGSVRVIDSGLYNQYDTHLIMIPGVY